MKNLLQIKNKCYFCNTRNEQHTDTMTLKYINKNIESLKEDLASTNKAIESIENHKGLLEFSDEKLNRAYRLREEIEHRIQDLETQKSVLLLQAMKASLQDCINEAKTDDERADYIDMMSKFEFLHPGI